jgi:16S rRNA (adenine1518-N6/adenine1519-N6)-dimethyltransferase
VPQDYLDRANLKVHVLARGSTGGARPNNAYQNDLCWTELRFSPCMIALMPRNPMPQDSVTPLIPPIGESLRQLGISPRKRLGQHFLTSGGIVRAITDAVDLNSDDVVVEVGAGLGALTRELVRQAGKVLVIEIDEDLSKALRDVFGDAVEVVTGDARQLDLCKLVVDHPKYKMLGNLPYYAALPILRRFLESQCRPQLAVVMVQKEVAVQMVATPGRMGILSVAVQVYGKPRIVRTVPPGAFHPVPKVMSAVVRIDTYSEPLVPMNETGNFFQVVRAGFSAPRKQLRNSLSQGLGVAVDIGEGYLKSSDIDPHRRAATVSVNEWYRLCMVVNEGA